MNQSDWTRKKLRNLGAGCLGVLVIGFLVINHMVNESIDHLVSALIPL